MQPVNSRASGAARFSGLKESAQRLWVAGEGSGPEGSQFAAHGALGTRRVRELSCPEDHPEPDDRYTDLTPKVEDVNAC